MDQDYVCEDYGTETHWTRIRVTAPLGRLDELTSIMSMVSNNLQIEDYSDIDLKSCYGDLIDESILNADKTVASVSVYLPDGTDLAKTLEFLQDRLALAGISSNPELSGVDEEDWANAWRQYYKPIKIGEKLVIVPAWEKYEPKEGELIVRMDPGMAFGTGDHETTRLVIRLLEDYVKPGFRVLDVGCGSGILAICASRLGAGECLACDIDPTAVRVAKENVRDSGLTNIECFQSDLLRGVDDSKPFDLITANIVADIIIRMTPDVGRYMHKDTVLLASGIITPRADDVISAMEAHGFKILARLEENDWCALAIKKK